MTPFHWVLAWFATSVLISLLGMVVYDVLAMLWDKPTFSRMGSRLPKLWVFIIGLAVGFILGVIVGHLWWPIMGSSDDGS